MKPIDFRNENFEAVKKRGLVSERLKVFEAFVKHGPGTTREISRRTGIDILSLRPRATELYQLGFLNAVEDPIDDRRTREGIYYALTEEQAQLKFESNRCQALNYQPELQLR